MLLFPRTKKAPSVTPSLFNNKECAPKREIRLELNQIGPSTRRGDSASHLTPQKWISQVYMQPRVEPHYLITTKLQSLSTPFLFLHLACQTIDEPNNRGKCGWPMAASLLKKEKKEQKWKETVSNYTH